MLYSSLDEHRALAERLRSQERQVSISLLHTARPLIIRADHRASGDRRGEAAAASTADS
jgi:hypothetical protein